MQIKSREELYEYLNHMDWEAKKDTLWSSVFFLVRYNDCEEPIYFEKYEDVYFERPCALTGFRYAPTANISIRSLKVLLRFQILQAKRVKSGDCEFHNAYPLTA